MSVHTSVPARHVRELMVPALADAGRFYFEKAPAHALARPLESRANTSSESPLSPTG